MEELTGAAQASQWTVGVTTKRAGAVEVDRFARAFINKLDAYQHPCLSALHQMDFGFLILAASLIHRRMEDKIAMLQQQALGATTSTDRLYNELDAQNRAIETLESGLQAIFDDLRGKLTQAEGLREQLSSRQKLALRHHVFHSAERIEHLAQIERSFGTLVQLSSEAKKAIAEVCERFCALFNALGLQIGPRQGISTMLSTEGAIIIIHALTWALNHPMGTLKQFTEFQSKSAQVDFSTEQTRYICKVAEMLMDWFKAASKAAELDAELFISIDDIRQKVSNLSLKQEPVEVKELIGSIEKAKILLASAMRDLERANVCLHSSEELDRQLPKSDQVSTPDLKQTLSKMHEFVQGWPEGAATGEIYLHLQKLAVGMEELFKHLVEAPEYVEARKKSCLAVQLDETELSTIASSMTQVHSEIQLLKELGSSLSEVNLGVFGGCMEARTVAGRTVAVSLEQLLVAKDMLLKSIRRDAAAVKKVLIAPKSGAMRRQVQSLLMVSTEEAASTVNGDDAIRFDKAVKEGGRLHDLLTKGADTIESNLNRLATDLSAAMAVLDQLQPLIQKGRECSSSDLSALIQEIEAVLSGCIVKLSGLSTSWPAGGDVVKELELALTAWLRPDFDPSMPLPDIERRTDMVVYLRAWLSESGNPWEIASQVAGLKRAIADKQAVVAGVAAEIEAQKAMLESDPSKKGPARRIEALRAAQSGIITSLQRAGDEFGKWLHLRGTYQPHEVGSPTQVQFDVSCVEAASKWVSWSTDNSPMAVSDSNVLKGMVERGVVKMGAEFEYCIAAASRNSLSTKVLWDQLAAVAEPWLDLFAERGISYELQVDDLAQVILWSSSDNSELPPVQFLNSYDLRTALNQPK